MEIMLHVEGLRAAKGSSDTNLDDLTGVCSVDGTLVY